MKQNTHGESFVQEARQDTHGEHFAQEARNNNLPTSYLDPDTKYFYRTELPDGKIVVYPNKQLSTGTRLNLIKIFAAFIGLLTILVVLTLNEHPDLINDISMALTATAIP